MIPNSIFGEDSLGICTRAIIPATTINQTSKKVTLRFFIRKPKNQLSNFCDIFLYFSSIYFV